MSDNPFESPSPLDNPSNDPLGGDPQLGTPPEGFGMVNQVQLVSIFMIVQGSLLLIMSLLLFAYAIFIPVMLQMEENTQGNGPPEEFAWIFGGVFGVFGSVIVISAALQIWAGIKNLKFRGRTLGMIAIFSNLAGMMTFYCAPTGIAVMVYGLIVYLNPAVVEAFKMGEQGATRDEILARFFPHQHQGPSPQPPPSEFTGS